MSSTFNDLWGRSVKVGGVVPGERVKMTLKTPTGTVSTGALVNSVQLRQERGVVPVMDLTSGDFWQLAQTPRPVSLALQGFVIDDASFTTFLSSISNVCSTTAPTELILQIRPPKCPPGSGQTETILEYKISTPRLAALENVIRVEEGGATFVGGLVIMGISLSAESKNAT